MTVRDSIYDIKNAVLGYTSELERLKTQASMGWEKEYRNMQWFGLRDGMQILEIGSGPGFYTEQLINNIVNSEVTALEIDASLLEEARSRLSRITTSNQLRFVNASVYDTGLPSETYDFAIARLVFLHLHRPADAAEEIFRVLKPGGKLVIIDVDDGLFGAVNPNLHLLPSILQKVASYVASKGGNRLIGRSLPRLLTQAGFTGVDMDSILLHSDIHGKEGFERQFDAQRFAGFYKIGVINEEEFEQLKHASELLSQSSDAYAMMNFVMAFGRKP